jgi:hypothetical protein
MGKKYTLMVDVIAVALDLESQGYEVFHSFSEKAKCVLFAVKGDRNLKIHVFRVPIAHGKAVIPKYPEHRFDRIAICVPEAGVYYITKELIKKYSSKVPLGSLGVSPS